MPGGTAATSEVSDSCGSHGHWLRYCQSILTTNSQLTALQAKLAIGFIVMHFQTSFSLSIPLRIAKTT